MSKIVNALKSVNKFGLLAIMLVAFATMAFKAESKRFATKTWGNDNGTWVDLTGKTEQTMPGGPGDYRCEEAETVCTAEFDDTISNPNVGNPTPLSTHPGEYVEL